MFDFILSVRARVNYITPEDMARIIVEIPRLNSSKWEVKDIEYLFLISYECALRITEACKLKKEDFDLGDSSVYLGKTKTEEHGEATIPDYFVPKLEEYLRSKGPGELLPGCNRFVVNLWLKKLGSWLDIAALVTPQSVSHEKTKCHIFRKNQREGSNE